MVVVQLQVIIYVSHAKKLCCVLKGKPKTLLHGSYKRSATDVAEFVRATCSEESEKLGLQRVGVRAFLLDGRQQLLLDAPFLFLLIGKQEVRLRVRDYHPRRVAEPVIHYLQQRKDFEQL